MAIIVMVLSFFLAGIYLILGHFHYYGLHIDHKIKPVEIATLLVNISIAVLLQYFFLSRSGNMRVEKDLIIEDIKNVIKKLRESNELFQKRVGQRVGTKEDWSNSNAQCRAISNALESVEFSLGSTKCNKCQKLKLKSDDLKQKFFIYKGAVTGTSASNAISGDTISDQAQAFRILIRDLQATIFEINRH